MDDARGEIAGRTLAVQHDARSRRSLAGTIRRSVSKVFHPHRGRSASVNGDARTSGTGRNRSNSASSNSSSSSTENEGEHGSGPAMLDPSINVNPLVDKEQGIKVGHGHGGKEKKTGDVSKHTFYIENSQTRLKLYAKNEVSFGVV
jgi:phospholipase D1/2